jgi:integrase
MSAPNELPLRDIHLPAAPGLWPPAPGWWLLAAILLAIAIFALWYRARRRRRREALLRVFDETVSAARGAPEQIAAMSELLRRASRRRDPKADRLHGDEWLRFLDAGMRGQLFSAGPGRLLLDGGFRPRVEAGELEALRGVARGCFLRLMERGR